MSAWLPDTIDGAPLPLGRPLLAISEVLGDLEALEHILDAVRGLELCGVVVAGDLCLGGAHPFEVWQRLQGLGATLVRGPTDLALGTLREERVPAATPAQREALERFVRTRRALGEVICRRLGELPTTAVVSLDDRSGVMVLAGTPRDDLAVLGPEYSNAEIDEALFCVAEDVVVCGRSPVAFARRLPHVLAVNAGSIARGAPTAGASRAAHAVLIQPYADGVVRAFPAAFDLAGVDFDHSPASVAPLATAPLRR